MVETNYFTIASRPSQYNWTENIHVLDSQGFTMTALVRRLLIHCIMLVFFNSLAIDALLAKIRGLTRSIYFHAILHTFLV